MRSDGPQCAAPLHFVAHTRCGCPRLRPHLRRDLLRLHPPRRPASVGAVHVGTRRREGYPMSAVSTPAPLACVRVQLGGARARRPLLRARVCAGARVPGGGCQRRRAAHTTRAQCRTALRGRLRSDLRTLEGVRVARARDEAVPYMRAYATNVRAAVLSCASEAADAVGQRERVCTAALQRARTCLCAHRRGRGVRDRSA